MGARRRHDLQLLLWLLFFALVIGRGDDAVYLAPLQQGILWLGAGLLAAAWLAGLFAPAAGCDCHPPPAPRGGGLPALLEGLAHGVPLLLYLLLGGGTLALMQTPPPPPAAARLPAEMTLPDLSRPPPGGWFPTNVLELTLSDHFDGAPVELRGRLRALDERGRAAVLDGVAEADRGDWIVYRYTITCCAADATPYYVVLNGLKEAEGFDWVTVRGHARPILTEPRLVAIEVEELEGIDPPEEPYLSGAMVRLPP